MRIFTCLKEVPHRDTRYQITAEGTGIVETDLTFEISECDEYSLEEALKLKEKHDGEVTILTVGREHSERSIRKGLSMGADRAILVADNESKASNPHAVALVLSEILRSEQYDLLLLGTHSDDFNYGQTGVILAELLGLPHATIVMEIQADVNNQTVRAMREMENGWFEWVEMSMPAVLTIQAGISKVRYPSLRGIIQAKKKEIKKIDLSSLELNLESVPQLEISKLYFPESVSSAEILKGDSSTVVAELVERLKKESKVL